jgi:hypothetical protein
MIAAFHTIPIHVLLIVLDVKERRRGKKATHKFEQY